MQMMMMMMMTKMMMLNQRISHPGKEEGECTLCKAKAKAGEAVGEAASKAGEGAGFRPFSEMPVYACMHVCSSKYVYVSMYVRMVCMPAWYVRSNIYIYIFIYCSRRKKSLKMCLKKKD